MKSGFTSRQLEGLRQYCQIIEALRQMAKERVALHTLVLEAIDRSKYVDYLKEDPESYDERRQNISELVSKAAEWEAENPQGTLAEFLEELSLKTHSEKGGSDAVRMMTLHHGKGLEFTVVFLVGMEEDLFPHVNSKENETAVQEERRLCYVGMTRAKDHLYLTHAKFRLLWGGSRMMKPSRFLSEIPFEHVNHLNAKPVASSEDFGVGDMVHHRDFGMGKVQKCYDTSLGVTYDIFFPEIHQVKSLVAKYAKLVKSPEDLAY
jgi:DNA helicase-2/ATP-dependent DNA helicase PcrA